MLPQPIPTCLICRFNLPSLPLSRIFIKLNLPTPTPSSNILAPTFFYSVGATRHGCVGVASNMACAEVAGSGLALWRQGWPRGQAASCLWQLKRMTLLLLVVLIPLVPFGRTVCPSTNGCGPSGMWTGTCYSLLSPRRRCTLTCFCPCRHPARAMRRCKTCLPRRCPYPLAFRLLACRRSAYVVEHQHHEQEGAGLHLLLVSHYLTIS